MGKKNQRSELADWVVGHPTLLATGVVVLWALNFAIIPLESESRSGSIGDVFGVANALFSALAFAALLYAVFLQRDELKLQRKELRTTRQVMRKQHAELERQARTMAKQVFENRFFQLLRTHQDIVEGTSLLRNNIFVGRTALKLIVDDMRKTIGDSVTTWQDDQSEKDSVAYIALLDGAYRRFYKQHGQEVGHYCRHLYHMLRFLKENAPEGSMEYARLIRAQLSEKELLLLFYNGISSYGREKFIALANEFDLFQNLPKSLLARRSDAGLYGTRVGAEAVEL